MKYYFTFCGRHDLAGYCQPIEAKDYGTAREKMFELHGDKWGFQYSEKEWQGFKSDPNRMWPMEKELETIIAYGEG
jgi:hypothetical protein